MLFLLSCSLSTTGNGGGGGICGSWIELPSKPSIRFMYFWTKKAIPAPIRANTIKDNTTHVDSLSELIDVLNSKKGFVSCFWNENIEDELKIKEETTATLRCYPLENINTGKSVNSDSENGKFAIFSKAY